MYPANHNSFVLLTNTQITLAREQALHIVKITRAKGDTHSLARPRVARFAHPDRRACSQAKITLPAELFYYLHDFAEVEKVSA